MDSDDEDAPIEKSDNAKIAERLAKQMQDNEEEDEDEDVVNESEEEDEEEEEIKPQKKRKINPFIEDQASVDEDDEDEDEDEEAEDGFENVEVDDELIERGTTRHRALDTRKQREQEEDAEEIVARLKERYAGQSYGTYRGDTDHIPQSLLLPSISDPKLWRVGCKPGKEKDIVLQLLQKFVSLEGKPNQTRTLSAFCRKSIPGYVYIEAEKEAHVITALTGIQNVYLSKLLIISISEMVDCLTIKTKNVELKQKSWVRVKRGIYSGDLGQVLDLLEDGEKALIKLVPRLEASADGGAKRKKSEQNRPPAKLFVAKDFPKREVTVDNSGLYRYQGEFFDKQGYVEKEIKISTLDWKNINPSLEEITKFQGGIVDAEQVSMLAENNHAIAEDFRVGETVVAISGELKNVFGTVKSISNDIITIVPDRKFNLAPLQYPARDLSKSFKDGDHVKVAHGLHADETGMVVKVENNVVTILSDSSLKTIQVFSKDLRSAAEVSISQTHTGQYDLQELVTLSPTEVGVIVKIEKDTYSVLNQYGNVVKVNAQQIMSSRDSSRAFINDKDGKRFGASDTVLVLDSSVNGVKKRANVLHVYRSFVFLQSREVPENNGIFVTVAANISVVNAKNQDGNNGQQQLPFSAPRGGFSPRGRGRGGMSRDPMIARSVHIGKGMWKGYLGIVRDTTETHARVELHTNNRIVTVPKDHLRDSDGTSLAPSSSNGTDAFNDRFSQSGGRTPFDYSGSKTPAHGGSNTPNPYGGSGAWNVGSKTPAWDGSRTPAWGDAGGRTPAYGGYGNSAYDLPEEIVPTPGGYADTRPITPYNPDTPYGPQTPGVSGIPATPGAGVLSAADIARDSWATTDIQVKIVGHGERAFKDGSMDGQLGVIRQVDKRSSSCIVKLSSGDQVVPTEFLAPVPPEKKQTFKVISGEHRDKTGILLSIDNLEGVVRFTDESEILMMEYKNLARHIISDK